MQNNGFLDFFGLRENPFNANLDPRFLLITPGMEKVFSEIMLGIQNGNSLAVVTGEVGTGKTTLMHRLRRKLQQQGAPAAFIFYTHLDRSHLLDFILANFGVPAHSGETIDAWKRLENWLIERNRVGQTPVLLIDEAQGLPPGGFEEIRMLLNLETPRKKLLQVVLAGQVELEDKLKRFQMRELQQRITARCKTAKLSRQETGDFVRNRLQVGGAKDASAFGKNAMDAIYLYSQGIPRVINTLCERALISAYTSQVRSLTPQLIEQVARSFQWDKAGSIPSLETAATLSMPRSQPILGPEPIMVPAPNSSDEPAPLVGSPGVTSQSDAEQTRDTWNPFPIPVPAAMQPQQSDERVSARDPGQRLIVLSERGNKKAQSIEATHSAVRHLLGEFIQELERQNMLRNTPEPQNIRRGESIRYALRRVVSSPLGSWWLYGERLEWRKKIGTVMDLPSWKCRGAKLQQWLNEPVRPFQWGVAGRASGAAGSSQKMRAR